MSNTTDPPIVVTGGSVIVEFKIDDFTQDPPATDGRRRHTHSNKKITRVVVTGDNITGYDQNVPNGKVTVTIYYGNGS